MARIMILVFGWMLVVAGADVGGEQTPGDAVKAELKKLQGTWQVTTWIDSSEQPAPPDEIKYFTFEFKGDVLILRKDKDDTSRDPLKCTLNPSKEPKWIDFDVGKPLPAMAGIYKLEGDELTICVVAGGVNEKPGLRPAEFKASKEKVHALFVLKRIKK
jgi:uncharacterized protein (TIGR03067 family)